MNQLQQHQGFKAELAIAQTIEEIKILDNKAAAVAEFAKKSKAGLDEQNEWGRFRVEIEQRKGAWLDEFFPSGGDRKSEKSRSDKTTLIDEGISKDESANARLLNHEPDLVESVMKEIEESGEVITPSNIVTGVRKKQRQALNITEAEVIDADRYAWMIPFVESARQVMKIEVCLTSPDDNDIVKAKQYIRSVDEKLSGNIWAAWPRIDDEEIAWIDKFEIDKFNQLILICRIETDTPWMQKLLGMTDSLCLVAGEDNMIIYIGQHRKEFTKYFRTHGQIFNRSI